MLARRRSLSILGLTTLAAVIGCGHDAAETLLQPPETFSWCAQPISFSPPSSRWRREAESSGGLQGVRFVLQGGGGQCVTVAAFRVLAERDRRAALQTLIRQADSLSPDASCRMNTGTKAALIAPSANRSRTRFGIRNATLKASMALPAPNIEART